MGFPYKNKKGALANLLRAHYYHSIPKRASYLLARFWYNGAGQDMPRKGNVCRGSIPQCAWLTKMKGGPLVPKIDNYSGTAYVDPIPSELAPKQLAHFCYDSGG